jgi:hypothetical protein
MLVRMCRKRNPHTPWWECELRQPLWKSVFRFPPKLKIYLSSDLNIPLLSIKEYESVYKRDTCITMVNAALVTTVKLRNQPK